MDWGPEAKPFQGVCISLDSIKRWRWDQAYVEIDPELATQRNKFDMDNEATASARRQSGEAVGDTRP